MSERWIETARETLRAWHKASPEVNGEIVALADHIARALAAAYALGQQDMQRRAVEAVRAAGPSEGSMALITEGFASAIAALPIQDKS